MNFKSRHPSAEPEINLIPLIDVLLVVMIFLLLTTSGARLTEMQIQLPEAESAVRQDRPQQIVLTVSAQGQFTVNQSPVGANSVAALVAALTPLALKETLLVIRADAAAQHQSVIHALEAARRSGLSQITFAAQSSASGDSPPATKP
ncbi:MAG: Biopolymer transport protein ExbD [Pseudomonadota bacterium]